MNREVGFGFLLIEIYALQMLGLRMIKAGVTVKVESSCKNNNAFRGVRVLTLTPLHPIKTLRGKDLIR
jgi:hypothetical protein